MTSDKELKNEMMESKKWVVVGVSGKKEKYGYKIWKILKENGYTTYGISPNYDELEGDKIYKSLASLPEKVDVLDMVVPPKISIGVLDEAKEAGIEMIFFQPGTYNDEVVAKAEELDLRYLLDDCVYATLKAE
ncbi:CoA-binding protein [Gudongella sp. DL1XJH-153]|uniref:CoA-binding protein n=1 Tax=Gudongella sp. DL1XJH-153 TaxID=3409804 RepID=UPI003BB76788